jgi:stearoyl-CoA desaturase (delta-9 desaturase)
VPQSILDEGARAEHAASVAAAQKAALVHPEYSSLKRVVPTAAALAVATVQAAHATMPRRAEGAAIHQDVTELASSTPPPSAPAQSQPPAAGDARD